MKLKNYLLAAVVCFIVISYKDFPAWAGTVSIPNTGQTSCWDQKGDAVSCTSTGQDGDIQAGYAWPNPRFTNNGDGTISDLLTGLMWPKGRDESKIKCAGYDNMQGTWSMFWTQSFDYIDCQNTNNYLGYSDWRLPNINEFQSLFNAQQPDPYQWLATQGFDNLTGNNYWSSTTTAFYTTYAWVISPASSFLSGTIKTGYSYVLPVRGGLISGNTSWGTKNYWATGQTKSYHSRDDGAIQAGAASPVPRFTDNGDGTVTDGLTGLMWTKDANLNRYGNKQWQNALDYIKLINTGTGYYGHTDWRLPNINEIRSLIDYSQYSDTGVALPAGNPFANLPTAAQGGYYGYWSSTTLVSSATVGEKDAYSLLINTGQALPVDKPSSSGYEHYVWPVRSVSVNPVYLTVTKSGRGYGSITSSDGKISCGPTCSASYTPPISTTLTAAALSASTVFAGWSGGCSGSAKTCTINSSDNVSVTAVFNNMTGTVSHTVDDFNGDGTSDILWLHITNERELLAWLLSSGTASNTKVISASADSKLQVAATGDFSGNGVSGILWRNSDTGEVSVMTLNKTKNKITNASTVNTSLDTSWQIKGVGDFNGDSKSDILLQDSTSGSVVIWLMDNTTLKDYGVVSPVVPSTWQIKGVGDFDGDSKSDILWQHSSTGAVTIWFMDNTTMKSYKVVSPSVDSSWQIKGVGDFDGDSVSDILWQNSTTGMVVIWLMNGSSIKSSSVVSSSVSSDWQIKKVGDYNGDGMSDILWQNSTTGAVVIWLMNGTAIKSSTTVVSSVPSDWQIP